VGGGLPVRTAGQHSDLIDYRRSDDRFRVVLLVLLAFDGVLCAIAAVLLLPQYIGHYWFPISAPLAGLVNTALVWAAMGWAKSARQAALPVITWVLTVAVLSLGGPGGDVVLRGAGVAEYSPLVLMLAGAGPPALLLYLRGHRVGAKTAGR
jgi:hypothetical protein